MAYSVTGLSYLTLLITLAYLIYRLFQYWQREKDVTAKQSLYFVGFFGLFVLIKSVGGLFFADNVLFLAKTTEIGAFVQAIAFAFMAYHIIYLKFPKISPRLGFIAVFVLGIIAAILTVMVHHEPTLEASGAINWGFEINSMAFLRLFLFLVTFLPLMIILFSQFQKTADAYIKGKTLGMTLALLFIIIAVSFDFLFIGIFQLDPIWRDLSFIICSVIFLIALILTLPRSYIKHEQKP